MGFSGSSMNPENISLKEAYSTIRKWYQANIDVARGRDDFYNCSVALIEALPEANVVTELEIRAILGEVIYGYLEWGYYEYDGNYHMASYAHGALDAAGLPFSIENISEDESNQLKNSTLWPHLIINRH